MQCPFCNHPMYSLDNGPILPQLSMLWICKQCPNEVRIQSQKDTETEQHWITRYLSIFVSHRDIKYCLNWDYKQSIFQIIDTSTDTGSSPVFSTHILPTISPENALTKLQLYILFS